MTIERIIKHKDKYRDRDRDRDRGVYSCSRDAGLSRSIRLSLQSTIVRPIKTTITIEIEYKKRHHTKTTIK